MLRTNPIILYSNTMYNTICSINIIILYPLYLGGPNYSQQVTFILISPPLMYNY